MKKNTKVSCKKRISFFAAAAMTAALFGSQVYPVLVSGTVYETGMSSIIPENVTIDEPVALSEIDLPKSDYGILSWEDETYVPDNRVQSCKVIFRPNGIADLSGLSGWDAEKGVVRGSVTVVVTSLEGTDENYVYSEENISGTEEVPVVTDAPAETENTVLQESYNDSSDLESSSDAEREAALTESAAPEETPLTQPAASEEMPLTQPAAPEETPLTQPAAPEEAPLGESTVPEQTADPEVPAVPSDESALPSDTPAAEITAAPDGEETLPAETTDEEEKHNNIFDNPADFATEDARPATSEENLTPEEEAARARENHSCNGIYVSGIDLPWYVQFRVSSGENYSFKNEEEAVIFQSYEFELWDLKNNTEYEIPDGQYISVTIPVKEGYTYTIEHLLDNGATETIIPSVNGSTMVFSTHSFSPFGIAGNKPIIGGDIAEDGYSGSTATPTSSAKPTVTVRPVQNTPGTTSGTGNTSANSGSNSGSSTVSGSAGNSVSQTTVGSQSSGSSAGNNQNSTGQTESTAGAVRTADDTAILPFAFLAAAAAFFIACAGIMKKRSRD